jgi:transposase
MRRLATRGGGATRGLDELVETLLIAELIAPSDDLWLLSPWISDIPVVDNRGGAVMSLVPSAPARHLRLTEVLVELARRGCAVRVLVRDDPKNTPVVDRLTASTFEEIPLEVRVVENLHEKGLLTSRVHVQGSMNFTHFGRTVNEEGIVVTSDPDEVAGARLSFQERFGGARA